jgi:hypothetical protein
MRRLAALGFAPLFAVAACSDDGGSTTIDAPVLENPGFPVPTAVTKANSDSTGAWVELGDADWSCLNTPSDDQPSTQAIALTGKIRDFQTSSTSIGNATVTAFAGFDTTGNLVQATSSNVAQTRGDYTMNVPMLPTGQTRIGFKIEASGWLKTYLLNQYLNPANATQNLNISAVSESTANALPAFVGVTRDPADGVLAGAMRDCQGREVSNAGRDGQLDLGHRQPPAGGRDLLLLGAVDQPAGAPQPGADHQQGRPVRRARPAPADRRGVHPGVGLPDRRRSGDGRRRPEAPVRDAVAGRGQRGHHRLVRAQAHVIATVARLGDPARARDCDAGWPKAPGVSVMVAACPGDP